jgi:hypothetical protein
VHERLEVCLFVLGRPPGDVCGHISQRVSHPLSRFIWAASYRRPKSGRKASQNVMSWKTPLSTLSSAIFWPITLLSSCTFCHQPISCDLTNDIVSWMLCHQC